MSPRPGGVCHRALGPIQRPAWHGAAWPSRDRGGIAFSRQVANMPRRKVHSSPIVPQAAEHPLAMRFGRLRRRVQLLITLRGLGHVAAVVIAAATVAALLDYTFRFEDPGGRLFLLLVLLGLGATSVFRFLLRPLMVPWGAVELARLLERQHPKLDGSLASALEFLETPADDPVWGSAELRRATIERTTAAAESLDLTASVRTRAAGQSLLVAGTVAALALALALAAPGAARVALARLLNPFGRTQWPQRYHLLVVNPVQYVALGDTCRILVVDRQGKRPPDDARIGYRFETAQGHAVEQWQPLQYVDRQTARGMLGADDPRLNGGALVAQRANITRPFHYRVEGGDDRQMPWTPVGVLQPPSVVSLRVLVTPPEYTGWAPRESEPNVHALVGSRVHLSALASAAVTKATLCLDGGARVQAQPADDSRRTWSADFVVEKSGAYWFELVGPQGLAGGADQSWAIQAVADSPPSVTIEKPLSTVFVTPHASVPLRILAKDDLAIRRISVDFDRTDRPERPHGVFHLHQGPATVQGQQEEKDSARTGDVRRLEYDWDLAPLQLSPGAEVTLVATATDYRPNLGKSDPRRLVVVTAEQLASRLAERHTALVKELARALEIERQVRQQTHEVQSQVKANAQLGALAADRIQGAQLNQRQVHRLLADGSEGAPRHIEDLLDQMQSNRIDDPTTVRRLEQLREQLQRIEREQLLPIGRELTFAVKSLRSQLQRDGSPNDPQLAAEEQAALVDSLDRAVGRAEEVIAALERLLGELGRWNQFREFQAAWNRFLEQQTDLTAKTRELAKRTLTKTVDQLSPDEAATLRVLSGRQAELARETAGAIDQMAAALDTFAQSDPAAAETVAQALRHARQSALDAQMNTAAEQLGANRMGRAVQAQQAVEKLLREILDRLANRPENQLEQVAGQLQAAAAVLAELTARQQAVQSVMEQAARIDQPDQRHRQLAESADRQNQLRDETERLAGGLRQAMANHPADWLAKAAEKMLQAGRNAEKDSAETASRWAQAATDDLQQAASSLADEIRRVEEGLATEQVRRLVEALGELHRRQTELLGATRQLATQIAGQPAPTRPQRAAAVELAGRQEEIRTSTEALRDTLQAPGVLGWLLASAGEAMSQGSGFLRQLQADRAAEAEAQAAAYLEQLLQAFRADQMEQTAQSPSPGQTAGQQDDEQVVDPFLLAQLKLIILMQEQIRAETQGLEEQFGKVSPRSHQAEQRYAELGNRQRQLARLLLALVGPAAPGTSPDSEDKEPPSGEPPQE